MGWEPRGLLALDTVADWRPFLLVAREARLQEVPWALDPLDFQLIGQVARAKRGPLWVYAHVATGRELSVDGDGVPHEVRVDRAMRIRTRPIRVDAAVWRTGVPEHELAREPAHRATHAGWEECEACAAWADEQDRLIVTRRRRRRRATGPSPEAIVESPTPARHLRIVR